MAEQGWEAVSELVLGRHLLLWDEILEQPFLQVCYSAKHCKDCSSLLEELTTCLHFPWQYTQRCLYRKDISLYAPLC